MRQGRRATERGEGQRGSQGGERAGKAGKSSLLNAILKEDRAIVTEYAGTTRDTIEEFINVNGIPLKLIDTAGIRNAKDEVERIGIERSKEIANNADLIIAVFDGSKDLDNEDIEILKLIKNKKCIIIINKVDLEQKIDENDEAFLEFKNNIIKISALNKLGIISLYEKITELFNLNEINIGNDVIITNIRHKNLISKAIESIIKAKESLINGMTLDVVSVFIKEILENLDSITGDIATDEIINDIFSKFCLGK